MTTHPGLKLPGKDTASLEERVGLIEDRLEILQLIGMHFVSVDGGSDAVDNWMDRWTEDAWFDRTLDPERHSGSYSGRYGKDVMREENHSPEMDALRETGIAHLNTLPLIHLKGDKAVATHYTTLTSFDDNKTYRIRAIVVSKWELRREDGEWRIEGRTLRRVGWPEARDLLLSGIEG